MMFHEMAALLPKEVLDSGVDVGPDPSLDSNPKTKGKNVKNGQVEMNGTLWCGLAVGLCAITGVDRSIAAACGLLWANGKPVSYIEAELVQKVPPKDGRPGYWVGRALSVVTGIPM